MLLAGATGLVALNGARITFHDGNTSILVGPDRFAHDFFLSIPASALFAVVIAIGLATLLWPVKALRA